MYWLEVPAKLYPRVPLPVIGLPVTVIAFPPIVEETDVTPLALGNVTRLPSPLIYCEGAPAQVYANVPVPVIGVPLTSNAVPATVDATEVTPC